MPTLLEISLLPAQMAFRRSDAVYRGFVGGIGSGKSWVGAYDLMRRSKPDRLYMAVAPTYSMMRDATLRGFLKIARDLRFLRDFQRSDMLARLGNGAEVIFRSADDPERLRGPNLSGVWMDEASLTDRAAWDVIIGRLREGGEQGWVSATFTPKGRAHWTFDVFGASGTNVALFHSKTVDNTFLPAGFDETVRSQYTSQFAAQELGGEFIEAGGRLAKREWFLIVPDAPARDGAGRWVRAWDFAATAATTADWTVGVLLHSLGGVWTIVHIVRAQVAGGSVEALVKQTAETDGPRVQIALEQEPGSSGKIASGYLVRALAGFNVRAVPVSGDKVSRAMPLLAQAEAGNVRLVRGPWSTTFLDEICAFPDGKHDDQVDAVAHGFNALARGHSVGSFLV